MAARARSASSVEARDVGLSEWGLPKTLPPVETKPLVVEKKDPLVVKKTPIEPEVSPEEIARWKKLIDSSREKFAKRDGKGTLEDLADALLVAPDKARKGATLLQRARVNLDLTHYEPARNDADQVAALDPALVCDGGAILLRSGKAIRQPEAPAVGEWFEQNGIPVLARLEAPALADGGDLLWLDSRTLVVGRGFRTNGKLRDRVGVGGSGVAVTDISREEFNKAPAGAFASPRNRSGQLV